MSKPQTDTKATRGNGRIILFLLLFGFVVSVGLTVLTTSESPPTPDGPQAVAPRGELLAHEKTTIRLFGLVAPSVVHIVDTQMPVGRLNLNILKMARGTGTGFVWDEAGHVVTNFHVIQGALKARTQKVYVIFGGDTVREATIVGADEGHDLAVLRILNPPKTRPMVRGTSHDLQVGQSVLAIGNPFGLDHTLTTGVISGLGREIESVSGRPIRGVIQTDAAINPGNSGGPLLDSSGRLIGINTAIASPTGSYAGIGFAVPADTVNRIVPQLIATGHAERPGLGVHVLPDHQARKRVRTGVVVHEVLEGSAASAAGMLGTRWDGRHLILGDVITQLDGRAIQQSNDLFQVLADHAIGDVIAYELIRSGRVNKRIQGELRLQSVH